MRADRVEVSWDQTKSNWLVRIVTGEEVIRRHCKAPKDADEQTLRSVAKQTIQDEGYEPEVAELTIRRSLWPTAGSQQLSGRHRQKIPGTACGRMLPSQLGASRVMSTSDPMT